MSLSKKIDFATILRVSKANPNGDPLNGNRPRTDYDGYGEISDVCIKRKIRDRIMEKKNSEYSILIQSDDRKVDNATSIKNRIDLALDSKLKKDEFMKLACLTWFDVRAFGQVFAFKSSKKADKDGDDSDDTGMSIPVRGPVSIHSAFSVVPVSTDSIQIVKSVNGEDTKDGKRSTDTMGMKHRINEGIYVFHGSMNPQLAEKTGFSDSDAEVIKEVLPKLFENDASSARPEGSMEVLKVIWWDHGCKAGKHSSAKVHRSLSVNKDGSYKIDSLEGLRFEELDGF